jgi:hypothetical protein
VTAPLSDLVRQRGILVILVAVAKTALTTFEAAGNPLDAQLRADLSGVIERSEAELAKLARKIEESS